MPPPPFKPLIMPGSQFTNSLHQKHRRISASHNEISQLKEINNCHQHQVHGSPDIIPRRSANKKPQWYIKQKQILQLQILDSEGDYRCSLKSFSKSSTGWSSLLLLTPHLPIFYSFNNKYQSLLRDTFSALRTRLVGLLGIIFSVLASVENLIP